MSTTDLCPLARALWWNAAAFGGGLALCLAALVLDPRTVEGANAWVKPSKFALSFGVHLATLAIVAAWAQSTSRLFVLSVWAIVATAWFEFVLIAIQATRGVRSHFNVETPFDAAVFTAMGVGVGALFLASVAAAAGLVTRFKQTAWPGIASGVAIFAGALGSLTALAMVTPTEAQLAGFEQGIRVSSGSRFPGGGEAMGATVPLLGWSLERGDYRIAHFFGVHITQVLLVWGWIIRDAPPTTRGRAFAGLLMTNAAAVTLLFWMASQDIGLSAAPTWLIASFALSFASQPVIVLWALRSKRHPAD